MGDVAQLPRAASGGSTTLPGLIDRARARLAEARTSAEVLEARAAAKAVLEYARVTKATREAQADCFLIIKYAEMRLVEEVRAAQERGELARHGGVRKSAIKSRAPGLGRAPPRAGSVSEVRALIRQPSMRSASQASASPNGAKSMMLAARPPSKKPFRRPCTKAAHQRTPTSNGRSREVITARSSPARTSGTRRICGGGPGVLGIDRPGSGDRAHRAENRESGPFLHPRRRRPAPRLARAHLAATRRTRSIVKVVAFGPRFINRLNGMKPTRTSDAC